MDGIAIVVVDDDLSVRTSLARLLRSAGYSPRTYGSARELLDAGGPGDAACMVLDIHLGGMSGIELAEKLRRAADATPAIFITAVDDETTRARALAVPGANFLRKPFDSGAFLDAIAAAVGDPAAGGLSAGA